MSEPVRRHVLRESGAPCGVAHDPFGAPYGHPIRPVRVLLARDEERRVLVLARPEVALKPFTRWNGQVGASMPIALSEHGDLVHDAYPVRRSARFARELELTAIEAEDLGNATPGGEHELQQRAGAHAVIRRGVAGIQEAFHALLCEVPRVRARLRRLRQLDLLRARNGEVEQRTELEQA